MVYDFHFDKVKIVHDVISLEDTFPYQKQPTETLFEEEDDSRTKITNEGSNPVKTIQSQQQTKSKDGEITQKNPNIEHEGGLTTLPDATTHIDVRGSDGMKNPYTPITTPSEDAPITAVPEPKRSGRERHAPNFYKPSSSSSIYQHSTRYTQNLITPGNSETSYWNDPDAVTQNECNDWYAFSIGPTARLIDEPRTYAQAMKSHHKDD